MYMGNQKPSGPVAKFRTSPKFRGFVRTHCHGINRLDDGFLSVHGKSEILGACSALAALVLRSFARNFATPNSVVFTFSAG